MVASRFLVVQTSFLCIFAKCGPGVKNTVIVHALFPLRVFTVHISLRVPLRVWSELIQGLGMSFISSIGFGLAPYSGRSEHTSNTCMSSLIDPEWRVRTNNPLRLQGVNPFSNGKTINLQ